MKIDQCKSCGFVLYKERWISPEAFLSAIEEDKLDDIEANGVQCKRCEVISANYFEGTFQLRNTKSTSFSPALDFINDFMALQEEKGRAFITKPMQDENGVDLLISSRKILVHLGKAVFEEFGGEIKVSKKLFSKSRQTSKEIWRVTVLVRLPDVNVRDVLIDEEKKELFQVKKHTKENITIENVINLKSKMVKAKDIKKFKIESRFYKVMVSRYKPAVEVIEPFEFQNVLLKNQEKAKQLMADGKKKKIRVFEYDGQWYCAD